MGEFKSPSPDFFVRHVLRRIFWTKYPRVAHRSPPELRWQSEWLLTTRSSVRSRVEAHFFPLPKPFFVRVFIFLCSGQSARMKTSRSGAGRVRQTAGCFVPKKNGKSECRHPGSNRGPSDLQSDAL